MLDLNTIRAAFARDLAADPLRHGLDRAFAAAVERAYRHGLADAALGAATLWQPCDVIPEPGTTALIATLTDDGECWALADSIYHHTGCYWREEQSGLPVGCAEFWWIAETDLTDRLPLPAPELEAAS